MYMLDLFQKNSESLKYEFFLIKLYGYVEHILVGSITFGGEAGSQFVQVRALLLGSSGLVLPWSTCSHVMLLNELPQQWMGVR